MHDVARRCDMNYVRSKDAQKQLARTSLRVVSRESRVISREMRRLRGGIFTEEIYLHLPSCKVWFATVAPRLKPTALRAEILKV